MFWPPLLYVAHRPFQAWGLLLTMGERRRDGLLGFWSAFGHRKVESGGCEVAGVGSRESAHT